LDDDERRRERAWIEEQRTAWGTPGRKVQGCLGPVGGWGVLFILLVLLFFSAVYLLRSLF
jgi:hypothetical protein